MSSNAAVPAGPAARARTRIVGITLAAVALLGAGAWAVDRWYAGVLRAEAGIRMESRLAGHASALELALAKRAALLNGLTAWMQERRGAPPEAFRTFAASLHRVDPGVRALQRVEGGRIVDSYPEEGNEGVLGLDVLGHPDPGVASGLRRALESGEVTVTGPVDLVQGGVGVILRRSVGGAGDHEATAAALVVDVRTLVEEAGIPTLLASLEVALETSDGVQVYGRPILETADPIRIVVPLPEGRWTLVAAPVGGWSAAVARDLRSERLGLLVFLVLGTLLVYAVVDRDTRLGWAVELRTAELTEANRRLESAAAELGGREQLLRAALAAGRVATWSWDIRNDELWRWGSGRSFYMEDAVSHRDTKALLERIHPEDRAAFARALEEARTTGILDH
ncbi:MAG TPA: CHASE domain-containing protein [Longimicrobiales bacterium]|nr:CHASE domain-containing protein [Longimicrobiales bacterium]